LPKGYGFIKIDIRSSVDSQIPGDRLGIALLRLAFSLKKYHSKLGIVAHDNNPTYSGGKGKEDHELEANPGKDSETISKTKYTQKDWGH
jgi:hypothetical protein